MSTPEIKDRREAQAYCKLWLSACESKVDPMAENHMMRLGAPIELDDIIFLRRFFWPHIDVEATVSVDDVYDKEAAYNTFMKLDDLPDAYRAPWTCIMSDLSQARALYLKHVLIAERMVADTHCCFVCPMRVMLPAKDTSGCILSEFKECMRDPVMALDGHSYERRNIEKWLREKEEKGEKAMSPMTGKQLSPFCASLFSNKTLKFAINEAVDRQLLEMMEQPRVKSDIEVAYRLLLQANAPDTPEQAGSRPAKCQRVTGSGSV